MEKIQEMKKTIIITDEAAKRLNALSKLEENPDQSMLRITVDPGGCAGFQYKLDFDTEVDQQEDTVFEKDGAKVVIDNISLNLISGSTLDYKQEMIGASFAITNPSASSGCGCGNSFSL